MLLLKKMQAVPLALPGLLSIPPLLANDTNVANCNLRHVADFQILLPEAQT